MHTATYTLPDGATYSYNSRTRIYTHALVARFEDGWFIVSTHQTAAAAAKALRSYRGSGQQPRIIAASE